MTNILVFSPYAMSRFHTAYEGTIAKGCHARGAKVEYIFCDGLLPECDMHWEARNGYPRPIDLCERCMGRGKSYRADLNLPYRWLGELVSREERERALDWAQSLPRSQMLGACFMDYPLGEWVLSTVITYFRQFPIDMDNWHVVNVYRGFLYSAALVTIGITNYLGAHSIDAALLFNGRQSITRVALEIFRSLGIRVLTHERPEYQRGHLNVRPNEHCLSLVPVNDFWRKWGHVPLTRSALETAMNWLIDRRYGRSLGWYAYNTPFMHDFSVRRSLGLSDSKRLMALFTSSTDEIAGDPGWQGPYESEQSLWVQDVVNWVKDRDDVELVIRVHPNLTSKFGSGNAAAEMNYYRELKSTIPDNCRLVPPEDTLNSYVLTDEADIGLTFGSTIGMEMAMLGKPMVVAARAFYEDLSTILTVRSRQELPAVLEASLGPLSTREIRREAFRWAYYYVFEFEVPFPLVSMTDVYGAKSNYTSLESLAPGQDKSLDHICNFLVEGRPLADSPTEQELARTTEDEDLFFDELERSEEPFRDVEYEQWLLRTHRWNRLGRSIQSALERLPFGIGDGLVKLGKMIYLPFLHPAHKKA